MRMRVSLLLAFIAAAGMGVAQPPIIPNPSDWQHDVPLRRHVDVPSPRLRHRLLLPENGSSVAALERPPFFWV